METSAEFCFLYSTFPDTEAAHIAARVLIEKRLAACVNVYPPMTSFYVWQGAPQEESEVAVFIKTKRTLADEVIAALRPVHPYTTPCFLVLPIAGGSTDYLAWARAQTERPVSS